MLLEPVLAFGPFQVRPSECVLTRDGQVLDVEPKVFEALLFLARHPNRLVTRDELLDGLSSEFVVTDQSLSQVVKKLRAALGEDAAVPTYVHTVRGRGYRFVVQVAPEAAPAAHTNLSPEPDRLVGRRADLDALHDMLLSGARLVTVHGGGGTGKTRLARHYGLTRGGEWGGGAWFVGLVDARNLDELLFSVSAALGVDIRIEDPADSVAQLGRALAARGDVLVILDNFEQLTALAAETVGVWLGLAPDARFLVTSREVLRIRGETTFALDPLTPDEASQLFLERARAVRRDLVADEGLRDTVAEIVARVDCNALAVELAAARTAVLGPGRILARLSDRMRLLATAGRDVHPRHSSLRSTIDWSWHLLEPWEQDVLVQCAWHRGSFTAESAESAVATGPGAPWVLDTLQTLREKSLLQLVGGDTGTRLRMSESVRVYCLERLEARPDCAEVRGRFATHYTGLGEDLGESLGRARTEASVERLSDELPNIRAAFDDALERWPELAARAALSLQGLLFQRGPRSMARDMLDRVGQLSGSLEPRTSVLTATARAVLRRQAGEESVDFEPMRLEAARLGDPTVEVDVLVEQSRTLEIAARFGEGLAAADRAHALAAGLEDPFRLGRACLARARCLRPLGRVDDAMDAVEEGQQHCHLGGFDLTELRAELMNMSGQLCEVKGQLERGEQLALEAIELGEAMGSPYTSAKSAINLGNIYMHQDRLEESERAFRARLDDVRRLGDVRMRAVLELNIGLVRLFLGDLGGAERLTRSARDVAEPAGLRLIAIVAELNLGSIQLVAGQPAALEQLERAVAASRASDFARIEGWSLLWASIAAAELGEIHRAARHLEAADPLVREAGGFEGPLCLDLAAATIAVARGQDPGVDLDATPESQSARLIIKVLRRMSA